MSIDEAMVKYKGRVFFRQYMPKKPIKWGIKVWMIAEPKPATSATSLCTWASVLSVRMLGKPWAQELS